MEWTLTTGLPPNTSELGCYRLSSVGQWKFSWLWISVAVTILSLLLISTIYSSAPPFRLPSSIHGLLGRLRKPPLPSDFPKAVIYRGAPWKPEIGSWLSSCDSVSEQIEVIEIIHGKDCKNECNNQGVCNKELGQCRCFHGYEGEDCSERLNLICNRPAVPGFPYGPWIFSMCATHCDTTRAMCFCGEGTKYPNRPVSVNCGFQYEHPKKPGEYPYLNVSQADHDNLFTTDGSKQGWCNVDPMEGYANKVNYKKQCGCEFDGQTGLFCEIPTVCSCVNQCSLHGFCHGGFCQCDNGWYGLDCSIPSISLPIQDWPKWIRPDRIEVAKNSSESSNTITIVNVTVRKRRPLIYVYDLPPQFNSHLLEDRHGKSTCVSRLYSDRNRTVWTNWMYGSQMEIYESILASPYRTMNGEEADYFYVPVFESCIIARADDTPHFMMKDHMNLRSFLNLDINKKAYDHIAMDYPFWNRSSGRDHIWFFAWDEGACFAPKEIWNSIMLVHWGNTNSVHNHSTTAYGPDNWDAIPLNRRGDHPCFDPDKDIILPSWKIPDPYALTSKLLSRTLKERATFFYFNGNLGPEYTGCRPEPNYSIGIRQKIAAEFGSFPNKEGKLGRQHSEDVIVTPKASSNYHTELSNSTFCGVFPGDGWSARMEASVLHGCIPVIIQDGIYLPYENVLDYESFAIRIREDDIKDMIKILRRINETVVEKMMKNVRSLAQRFRYRDSLLLEAERQKVLFGDDEKEEGWAVEFSKLEGDDVFSTFIQILRYKLYHDKWRRVVHGDNRQKDTGLPKACLKRNEYPPKHK